MDTSIDITFKEAAGQVYGKLEGWLTTLIDMLPNMAVALVVIILFGILGFVVKRSILRFSRKVNSNVSLVILMANVANITILAAGLFVALSVLNLDKTVTSLLAGAGIIGLALGFAFQDTAANFIAGVFMAFRKPIRVGDIIESQDFMGTVQNLNLRTTVVHTFQGQEVLIPNKDVFGNAIVNFTKTGERRVDIPIGVSYGDDLEKAEKVALDAVKDLDGLMESKETTLFYDGFGDSSINFTIRLWTAVPEQPSFLQVRSDAIKAIKKAFDENDITIPFPIRTLDFGIKGGEKLEEMQLRGAMNGTDN